MATSKSYPLFLLCIVGILFFSEHSNAQNSDVFWFNDDHTILFRGDISTSEVAIVTELIPRQPAAIDYIQGKLYWADNLSNRIWMNDPAQPGPVQILSTDDAILSIRIDEQGSFVYWLEDNPKRLRMAGLDGSGSQDLITSTDIGSFRIDTINNKLYWGEKETGRIRMMDLSDRQIVDIVTEAGHIHELELDIMNYMVYWGDEGNGDEISPGIYRSDISRGIPEMVINTAYPGSFTVDSEQGKLYWAGGDRTILRANLDGGGVDTILTDQRLVISDLLMDPDENYLFWIEDELGARRVMRVNLEDGHPEPEEVLAGYGEPNSATMDAEAGVIYFTTVLNEVMKVELENGMTNTVFFAGVGMSSVGSIALNGAASQLYWGYFFGPSFGYANTADSWFETFYFSTDDASYEAGYFTFDVPGEWTYWAGYNNFNPEVALFRVNSNNPGPENVEKIIAEEHVDLSISGIALDLAAGKIYWSESNPGRIRRANLDGSNLEDILTGLQEPLWITTDVENMKIYWTERGAGKIRRANLDGTDVEDLFTDLVSPGRLVVPFASNWTPSSIFPGENAHSFYLYENYPNPFNSSTTILYELTENNDVHLAMYDILGRQVAVLVNESRPAGTHHVAFDASSLSSGVYMYRLQAGGLIQTRKMVLIR